MTDLKRRRRSLAALTRVRPPLTVAVLGSRLLVLAAGAAGDLFAKRIPHWQGWDPQRLSVGMGQVGNVLGAAVMRWDATRYVALAEHGYTSASSTVSFPLYPLLTRAVSWVVRSPVISGVLISTVAFTAGLVLVHRIAREELGIRPANTTVLLLSLAPLSFFFTAVYTESLFLALSVGSFYLARQQKFAFANLVAAGASLTRIEGVLLIAPIAVMYWRSRGPNPTLTQLRSWTVPSFALPPLALAGFFAYLHAHGYGWLAPITNQDFRFYGRTTLTPPVMLWKALSAAISGLWQTLNGVPPINPGSYGPFSVGFDNFVELIVLAITLAALLNVWRRLPKEYALYAGLAVIVCTWSGVVGMPLDAFARYMLPIFPLWMGAADWLGRRRLTPTVLSVSTLMLVFYTVEFARWVPNG